MNYYARYIDLGKCQCKKNYMQTMPALKRNKD